jgi:bifunctional DNase/RNase
MAAGSLTLPIALAAGSMALLAGSAPPAPSPDQRVELEVVAVLPLPQSPAGLLVLREHASGTILPVLVPDGSALDVAPRKGAGPQTGGLAGRAIAALGARVREVEIDAAEETATASRIRLVQGSRDVELPARPSESVPLAVAAGARIVATRRLLASAGLTPEELESIHAGKRRGSDTEL